MYEYREVKCPLCGQVFMWNKRSGDRLVIHEYRFKETGKLLEKTKCPKCSMDMVVLEHILEGIGINDDRIEIIGVRGIWLRKMKERNYAGKTAEI